MRYGTVCSGIEAPSVAWDPLGWEAAFYSEIEPFPSAVLHHHYGSGRPHFMPDPEADGLSTDDRRERRAAIKAVQSLPLRTSGLRNFGDMTRFQEWPDVGSIDLLIGGTPCQAFSVAGLRAGLADPRGNLTLTFLGVVARYQPRVVVWENVPGVLSIDDGKAFGALLGGLAELGYGWAYRIVDAQHSRASSLPFAVPQRRRRVFVIGYLGDWRRAAAVLFDGASLRGDPPPRREAGQIAALAIDASSGRRRGSGMNPNQLVGQITGTLNSAGGRGVPGDNVQDASAGMLIPEVSPAMKARDFKGVSSDGTGDGLPIIPVAPTLLAPHGDAGHRVDVDSAEALLPIAFHGSQDPDVSGDVTHPLGRNYGQEVSIAIPFDTTQITHPVSLGWKVRRLLPVECERLMGYPDSYTNIPWRGNGDAPDGPRYKALGNSMATNVIQVLGERIAMVDAM